MRNPAFIFTTILWCLVAGNIFSQDVTKVTNLKEGKWSDTSIWPQHKVPNENDPVLLSYNILIDTIAFCKSLMTNGCDVTVLSGCHLTITGGPVLKSKNIIRLSATTAGSEYGLRKWEWKYDSLNRCTELLDLRKSEANDTFKVFARFSFFYSGSSITPFRVFQDQNGENIKSDAYFKFDSVGKKIQDSIIYIHAALGQLLKIYDYRYESDTIYSHFRRANISWTDPSTDFTFNTNDTIYLSGGNALEFRKQSGSLSKTTETYHFTYDNGVNPLAHQNIAAFYKLGPDFNFNRWQILESVRENLAITGFNNNNITSYYEASSPQRVVSYTYHYDNDNYPIECTISFSYFSGISKVTYEYKD